MLDPATGLMVMDDDDDDDGNDDNDSDCDKNVIDTTDQSHDDADDNNEKMYDNVTLHRENCCLNLAQRQESLAVQYLAMGGYKHFILAEDDDPELKARSQPDLVCSGMHAGAGQQVFGWSPYQRADLLLAFFPSKTSGGGPTVLNYHNYHGGHWHYNGHLDQCPNKFGKENVPYEENVASSRMDNFRRGLAEAFTLVNPERVIFRYTTSNACQLFHGMGVPSLDDDNDDKSHFDVKTALLLERPKEAWLPFDSDCLNPKTVESMILSGQLNGFVTVKGGREHPSMLEQDPAGSRFGFCVQNYAPKPNQVSPHTKQQISDFYNWGPIADVEGAAAAVKTVNKYLTKQNPRTITATTFHTQETVSTTYLRWLMKERKFENFKITHLMIYEFKNWSRDFLEPILQARHDYKKEGNVVAAECLKLIGNGSFGYNGLESCNYDQVRLMTDDAIRKRRVKDLGHLTFKHLTMIGVVKLKTKKKKKKKKETSRQSNNNPFIDEEASDDDDDDESSATSSSEDEEEEEEEEEVASTSYDDFRQRSKTCQAVAKQNKKQPIENVSTACADLEEALIGEVEQPPQQPPSSKDSDKYTYRWQLLYAVVIDGKSRTICNNIPKAVAVLSNSKQLFLSHLNVMFQCLNPGLAEMCYIDTDSCIWSLSYQNLDDCLRADKKDQWLEAGIIADESGSQSCHGKMKLEGSYWCGKFKTMKIYRLYQQHDDDDDDEDDVQGLLSTAYTRCKGINRWIADRLPNYAFDPATLSKNVVHRSTLKPSRTGQMTINHEARSLAVPFNLKRYTLDDGIHTLPLSFNVNNK